MKTKEDICRLKFENWNDWKKSTRKMVLDVMEEYASQPSDVSDEDIEKAAIDFQNDTTTSFNQGMYSGYIFGAIDMRNGKIKKGE